MGAKLVWWLVTGTQEWWKTILFKNYFSQTHKIFLDVPLENKNGSTIWNMCRFDAPFIQSKLTWVPGNGKFLNI
jgi:hypothetical protein